MPAQLTPQTFDVPIRPGNQQAPSTAAPVGRVRALVNKVASRNEGGPADANAAPDSGTRIVIEPRNGFQSLSLNVRNVTSGAVVSTTTGVQDAKLVATLGNELLAVAGSAPHVLSENSPAWSKYPYVYSPVKVRTVPVVSDNIQIANPDVACIGGITLRTWSQPEPVNGSILGARAKMIDIDGTVVRSEWTLAAGNIPYRAKVVADGVRFWVATGAGDTITVDCYDTHGVQIGTTLAMTGILEGDSSSWDLTFCEGYVLLAHTVVDNAVVRKLSISGTTLSQTLYTLGSVTRGNHGVAWAENASGDGNAYLLTSHMYTTIVEYAYRIGNLSTTPTVTGYFSVAQSAGNGIIYDMDGEGSTTAGGYGGAGIPCELSGIYRGGVLYAQVSFLEAPNTGGDVRNDRIVPLTCTVGSTATAGATVRTVRAASRVFSHGGRDVLLVYYPSQPTVITGTFPNQVTTAGEPSYFMLDVLTMQVCGRFDLGIAGMEWTRTGFPDTSLLDSPTGPFFFCVPHVAIDSDGFTHVPVGFQSRQFAQTLITTVESRSGPGHFSPTIQKTTSLVTAVGYQDLIFGGYGQALEFGGELLLPGAIATSFDGATFSEEGISLSPQQPLTVVGATGGSMDNSTGTKREYVIVWQTVDRNGNRILSSPSAPFEWTPSVSDTQATLTGLSLRMTTRTNVVAAIYRNIIDGTVPSTVHWRVDDPLNPVVNSPSSKTWTFVDQLSDLAIQSNERLYTDDDFRPRDPMPSFSTADIFDGRVVSDAPDGSIWFSAQKVEGDATWFSASQRIPAVTSDPIQNLVAMDGRLVEIYDRHVWMQDASGFPGPTISSVGSIRAAERTTFTNGGTGFARLVNEGVMYSSSEGGAWLITRGHVNQRVTGPVVDEITGHALTGIVVDGQQRIHIGCTAMSLVFDQLSGVWSRFDAPILPAVMHTLRGRILHADPYGVYVEDPLSHTDVDHAGAQQFITGLVEFKPFHFMSVKRYERLWRFNVQGATLGNHTVTMVATYDPETAQSPLTESWTWAVTAGDAWAFEFQPKIEQIEALSLSFVESFPAGPTYNGKSFRLEMLGFEVGLEQGLARVPLAKRIQST